MMNALITLSLIATNPALAGGDYYYEDPICGCATAMIDQPMGLGLVALAIGLGLAFARRR